MSHLATPDATPPNPASDRAAISPTAVALVAMSVFGMLAVILAYAAHHGLASSPEELARQARQDARDGKAAPAQVIHVSQQK